MKNNLRVLRAERNFTQTVAAKKAGISRTAYSLIEKGVSAPDGNTIASLVKAFGVPANKIFFDFDVVLKQRNGDEDVKIQEKQIG